MKDGCEWLAARSTEKVGAAARPTAAQTHRHSMFISPQFIKCAIEKQLRRQVLDIRLRFLPESDLAGFHSWKGDAENVSGTLTTSNELDIGKSWRRCQYSHSHGLVCVWCLIFTLDAARTFVVTDRGCVKFDTFGEPTDSQTEQMETGRWVSWHWYDSDLGRLHNISA